MATRAAKRLLGKQNETSPPRDPQAPDHPPAPVGLRQVVTRYARPDARRALFQLLNTALPFAALLAAMAWGVDQGAWLALLLALPAAGLLVRLFMFQHDCGHGAFFRSRWANDLVGRAIGVLTLTPYQYWRRQHAMHHATSGNLDRRGAGDISTLTVREYLSRSFLGRLAYRAYRHPLVLFGVGPAYQFLIRHRIPTGHPLREWRDWLSIVGTNLVIAVIVLLAFKLGAAALLLGYLPVMLVAASVGIWLFYVQHQFEHAYWETETRWSFEAAALRGCSFYDLPGLLRWTTAHIGLHHIHHLSSRVPNYRLRECFAQNPALQQVQRLTLWSSLRCVRLSLWDEDNSRMVPFRALRRR
jgi:acyl-lipid omega-6 desaturase (Delta-12 desaturase)